MNLINGIFKVLYWPICRAYARHLGDRPADAFLRIMCSLQFLKVVHFWPNFVYPQRFSEKVWSRMLHERDPIFTLISDKLSLRDYVSAKVGSEYLVPLLWYGDKPEEIRFDELPEKFVIKANHGCDYTVIVRDKAQLDRNKTCFQLKKWLRENFGKDKFLGIAWGYKNIKPSIIIESFLSENGKVPVDYKFFCFSGRVEFFKIDFDRFENHSERFFGRELNELDLCEVGLKLYQEKINLPNNIKEMFRVAECLAQGFDFIRVDLYNLEGRIYVGELTPYPGGVSVRFNPDSFDYLFGEKWNA